MCHAGPNYRVCVARAFLTGASVRAPRDTHVCACVYVRGGNYVLVDTRLILRLNALRGNFREQKSVKHCDRCSRTMRIVQTNLFIIATIAKCFGDWLERRF